MDVIVTQPPGRDLAGITFADLTAVPFTGYDIEVLEEGWTAAVVCHFTGDLTPAEQAACRLRVTTTPAEETMRTRARAAITANGKFLAQASPRSAQQLEAQLVTVTREATALIRLALGLLDDAAGT